MFRLERAGSAAAGSIAKRLLNLLPPDFLIPVRAVLFPAGGRRRPPLSPKADGFHVHMQMPADGQHAPSVGGQKHNAGPHGHALRTPPTSHNFFQNPTLQRGEGN